jgi:mRNA interferase MazF
MSISRGEVWQIEFYPQVGSEITKLRPAVVISHDSIGRLPLKTIVPITDWKPSYEHYPWMIHTVVDDANGLSKTSAIDCFQVKNFDDDRFVKKLGVVDDSLLIQVHQTVLKTFDPSYSIS